VPGRTSEATSPFTGRTYSEASSNRSSRSIAALCSKRLRTQPWRSTFMKSTTASYLRWLKNALVFRDKVNRGVWGAARGLLLTVGSGALFKVQGSMFNVVLGSVPDVPMVRLAHHERKF
jgi:hypothetical protein